MTQPATDEMTIDSIIKTVNEIYKFIQLQDAHQDTDEGVKEVTTQEDTIKPAKSLGEILVENTIGGSGGTGFGRTKSATIENLRDPHVNVIHKLNVALRRLKRNLKHLKSIQLDVEIELNKQLHLLKRLAKDAERHMRLTKGISIYLEDITKDFLKLLNTVPEKRKETKSSAGYQEDDRGNNNGKGIVCLHGIHANDEELKTRAIYRYVQSTFIALTTENQICLLSFAVFPENTEVNRTMLMYWWIGEGILAYKVKRPDEEKPEDAVKKILKEFTDKRLIEAVENKRKVEPNSYKVTPFVHSSLVLISKEIGLFDMYRKGEKPTMNKSKLNKVCLVEGSSSQPEAKAKKMELVKKIETVFNVSERFPDFTFKWFGEDLPLSTKRFGPLSKHTYRALKVFYLGRWDKSAKHHIKVHNPKLMKFLKHMTRLKLLSFQGISTIKSLSRSACKLRGLVILDLRDCYNLEKLPDDIDNLRSLVYLDLTGCDALESIPVKLAWLSNLEVLKGFVIADEREIACKLSYLEKLLKLRKLSVTVDRENFGLHEVIVAIRSFEALEHLKVRWRSGIPQSMNQQNEKPGDNNLLMLPEQLRKLDLQCFPDTKLPNWLQPQNLYHLEKLYLGSWRYLEGFGALPTEKTGCSVKVLRLTCMPKLRVEWRDLKELYFPNLNFLESYKCPRVTFCPCDRDGIWRSDQW